MDNEGGWLYDNNALRELAYNYYVKLFSEETNGQRGQTLESNFEKIPDELFEILNMEISNEEVKEALFSMSPFKAPGSDGFQPIFFQKEWETVSQDLISFVKKVYEGQAKITSVN